ncbi:hypothetical protein HBI56_110000 [Parastagonospora nodorum]|uniref:Uncharacterized protein n=1 Tax=Phaeosphaeria nodorum (strain SN15 / ATCC MYA-4574 / FGSC 10173) TaxID=321614 RepID=A0A7U2ETQ5_PHANO|nr:hypothetical protein HBH56_042540 [Parastagonospora nodorum]QRC92921.1 hypothetical protein JI435_403180 [Parastagonospora nodorum SN15]KAH3932993.1 hypothetical protein HBH54_070290 [Parastagonospora nodorum]KAH3980910.1 hypothetical protein HBH51_048370 [Parastagonospora nodorum]KAH4038636.1 hypothetical protein HBI09_053760 [Parastagonospora nodorum]
MVFAAFRTTRLRRDVLHHVKTQTRALTAGARQTSVGHGVPKSIYCSLDIRSRGEPNAAFLQWSVTTPIHLS